MATDYNTAKKVALRTIILLGVITVVEVLIALAGKGYLVEGWHWPWWLMGIIMITLSLYKAYKIVGEFMHLGHEVRGMGLSVVLPMFLLVWAVIAFMYEGGAWKNNREVVDERSSIETSGSINKAQGMLIYDLPYVPNKG